MNGPSLAKGLAGASPLSLSKMLKSVEKLGVWTLRRLAEGLPREAWSRFMMPSLRFKGLTVAKDPKVPLRRFSMRERVERGAKVVSVGVVLIPQGLWGVVLSTGPAKSSRVRAFSSPGATILGGMGVVFPASPNTVRARLAGLRGDVRRRMTGRVILALGGYGTARGEGWVDCGKRTKLFWDDRREGDRGEEM